MIPGACERCGNLKPASLKMSFFNTQMLCPECVKKEEAHPEYAKAREAERQAVLSGNYNFPGIGLPSNL